MWYLVDYPNFVKDHRHAKELPYHCERLGLHVVTPSSCYLTRRRS